VTTTKMVTHFAGLRRSVLDRMGALTSESTDAEIKSVMGCWQALRREVGNWCAEDLMCPDSPQEYFSDWIWKTNEWRNFDRARTRRKHRRPDIRMKRQKAARAYYATTAKEARSTPEMKAVLAQRKREERARRRAETAADAELQAALEVL
jgi:hypothetical protein